MVLRNSTKRGTIAKKPQDGKETPAIVAAADADSTDAASVDVESGARGRFYSFGIKLAIGLSLAGVLLWRYDLGSTFHLVRRERLSLFAATGALFVGVQVISAFRWQLLARIVGVGGRYRDYLGYFFIGMFTNIFVPGLVGGDALRAIYLGRRHGRMAEAFASVAADRGAGLLGLVWFAALVSLLITKVQLPPSVLHVTLAVAALSVAAYLAAPLAVPFALRIKRLNSVLSPLARYLRSPIALLPALALSVALQFSFAFCQYVLGIALGLQIPLTVFLLTVPISNVIASIPISINGLGLREASYVVLMGIAGVSKNEAIALSISYFAATTLAGGLAGIIPFMLIQMPGAASAWSGSREQPAALPRVSPA